MLIAEVIKPTKILGVKRVIGDTISRKELSAISGNSLDAMVSDKIIVLKEDTESTMHRLTLMETQVKRLKTQITSMNKKISSGSEGKKSPGRPRKIPVSVEESN